jgi:SAM-dependent methyltransferase
LGAEVVELLAPRRGERVLDLGCGDGALSAKLVDRGCRVVAVDSSPDQIVAAKARGLDARIIDARRLDFEEEFDAVFSNAVLHWVGDIDRVLDGVGRALKPGGRFVGEFGGSGNVETVVSTIYSALEKRGIDGRELNPWYFPTVEAFRARLNKHGFEVNELMLFGRPTKLPGSVADWMDTFAKIFTAAVPEDERAGFVQGVSDALKPRLFNKTDGWVLDYVRLRFKGTKPIGPS